MSLIIDASRHSIDPTKPSDCLEHGPFNTILIHAPENSQNHKLVHFSTIKSFNFDHLIVLNNAWPSFDVSDKGDIMKRTSLVAFKNKNLAFWGWLRLIKFKYIRIDSCTLSPYSEKNFNEVVLSEYSLTLSLVNNQGLDPWKDLRYELAPNLRELLVNHYQMPHLNKQHSNKDFRSLKRLNLDNNRIETIEEGFFDSMPILQVVSLESNLLETFTHTFMSRPKKIYMDG